MEKINKNDFIEIDFTGISNDEIFDTTNPKDADKLGINTEAVKPLIISVGNDMLLKGFDEQLAGKELNKEYSIQLNPDKAFGPRNPNLIKTYSLNNFKKQNINPYPGMAIQLDNLLARVISVSGGRVIVDFNNPLAGKQVSYNFKILKKITDNNEKINALQDFFFRKRFDFKINENSKKVIFKEDIPLLKEFKDKFKEIIGFYFEVEKNGMERGKKDMKNEKEESKIKVV